MGGQLMENNGNVRFCSFCGKPINLGDNNCHYCGKEIPKTNNNDYYRQQAYQHNTQNQPNNVYKRTDGYAIAALVCGIASFASCGLLGILAVIFGNTAKRRIEQDPSLEGDGMAVAGIILGWISIGLGLLFWLLNVGIFGTLFSFSRFF